MQRVADALHTRPMSLYTHVGNREDLIAAVTDLAFREWTVDVPSDAGWEDQVRGWCHSLRNCMRDYPLLVWEFARDGRTHPALLRNVALLIRSLRLAGVDGRSLTDVVRWIPQTVLGAVVLELSRPVDLQSVADEASSIYASLGELPPGDRAEIVSVLAHFTDQSLDGLFNYSVERIIDGVYRIARQPEL